MSDDTGGRCYWPIRCSNIDLDRIKAERKQLFAEALAALGSGAKWWPDREFEADHIRPRQADRYEGHSLWDEPVRNYLAGSASGDAPPTGAIPRERVTLGEVARHALGLEKAMSVKGADSEKLRVVLRDAGWDFARSETGEIKKLHGTPFWIKLSR